MEALATKRKLSILDVRSMEEEILLIQEAEEDYAKNGAMSIEEAYAKGLKYIQNLGK